MQLVPQRPRRLGRGGGVQRLRGDAAGLALVHRLLEPQQQRHLAARRGKDPQMGAHGVHRPGQAEQPPAGVQRFCFFAAARFRFHPGGQAREGQHLRPQAHPVAADGQQLPLRLVAVLLRDDQHAFAALRQTAADILHDGGGLAGLRPP